MFYDGEVRWCLGMMIFLYGADYDEHDDETFSLVATYQSPVNLASLGRRSHALLLMDDIIWCIFRNFEESMLSFILRWRLSWQRDDIWALFQVFDELRREIILWVLKTILLASDWLFAIAWSDIIYALCRRHALFTSRRRRTFIHILNAATCNAASLCRPRLYNYTHSAGLLIYRADILILPFTICAALMITASWCIVWACQYGHAAGIPTWGRRCENEQITLFAIDSHRYD